MLPFSARSKKNEPSDTLSMNIPKEEVVVYTQTDPINTDAWASVQPKEDVALKLQNVESEGSEKHFSSLRWIPAVIRLNSQTSENWQLKCTTAGSAPAE